MLCFVVLRKAIKGKAYLPFKAKKRMTHPNICYCEGTGPSWALSRVRSQAMKGQPRSCDTDRVPSCECLAGASVRNWPGFLSGLWR